MTGITNTLVTEDIFENIRGKKEIESRFRVGRRGHRKIGFEPRTGGRPSVNKFTQRFETIIRVMAKQEACDLLREKLLRLRLTYEFERFNIMAFLYLMKMDAGAIEKLLRLIGPRYNVLLDKSGQSLRSIIHNFDSFDDKQIEAFTDEFYVWSAETRPYDLYFIFCLARL